MFSRRIRFLSIGLKLYLSFSLHLALSYNKFLVLGCLLGFFNFSIFNTFFFTFCCFLDFVPHHLGCDFLPFFSVFFQSVCHKLRHFFLHQVTKFHQGSGLNFSDTFSFSQDIFNGLRTEEFNVLFRVEC